MMLMMLLMLMCIGSLTLHGTMNVVVHNLYSDIELVSPVHFCDNGTYNEYSVERTDVGAMMRTSLRFGLDKLPGGILIYEVQKKGDSESDYQYSIDTAFAEVVEDTSKMMRLLVAWKIKRLGEPKVHMMLVKHSNELVLSEDKLAQLYGKVDDQLSRRYSFSEGTWLVHDNTVLYMTYETAQKEGLELNIVVSKGAKNKYTKSAFWIDSKRHVSFLTLIYIC
jgi:hypothetical protein